MKEKISTVKNPLTVIAIFAGTAEISGTAILPLLEAHSQQTYIWFLMLFPLILIIFFFLTLNWNHKVLYAPSDFSNEDNFVNILKKPSIQDTISNLEEDIEEEVDENEEEDSGDKADKSAKNELDAGKNSTKAQRKKDSEFIAEINRKRVKEGKLAELLVLEKLEKELNSPIEREMMMKIGRTKIIFDGVVQRGSSLTGIEVKYWRSKNALSSTMWESMINRFERLFHSLSDSQKKSFSIIFAIVTHEETESLKQFIENKMKILSFPVDVRIYDFDQLRNESDY